MGRSGNSKKIVSSSATQTRGSVASQPVTNSVQSVLEGLEEAIPSYLSDQEKAKLRQAIRSGVITKDDLDYLARQLDYNLDWAVGEFNTSKIADILENIFPKFNRDSFNKEATRLYDRASEKLIPANGATGWKFAHGVSEEDHEQAVLHEIGQITGDEPTDIYTESQLKSIVDNPRYNDYFEIDLDPFEEWQDKRHRDILYGALGWSAGSLIPDTADALSDDPFLILNAIPHSKPAIKGRDYSDLKYGESDQYFIDDNGAKIGNRRSYKTNIDNQEREVKIVEKRNNDGRAMKISIGEEGDEQTVSVSQAAADKNVLKALVNGKEVSINSDAVEKAGGLEAWAISRLEKISKSARLKHEADSRDPSQQTDRLLSDL